MFQQFQGLRHILAKTRQPDGHIASFHRDIIAARQLIELLSNLLGRQRVGTYIIKVRGGIIITSIYLVAEVIAEGQLKAAVLLVLDGDNR